MGHFKNQLRIPNTHQFTSQHPPPGTHTRHLSVQLPAQDLRSPAAQGRRPLACAAGPVLLLLLGRGIPQTPGREPGGRSRGGGQGWAVNLHLRTKGGRAPAARVGPSCYRRRPSAGDALGPRPQRSLELLQPRRPGQHCHVPVTLTREKEPPERDGGQQNPGWNKAGSARSQAATMG